VRRNRKHAKFAQVIIAVVVLLASSIELSAKDGKKARHDREGLDNSTAVLWSNPTDIASRNLFYGPGGEDHEPHSRFTFLKEDLDGTNPKFDVRDEDGVKWKVKLGLEARPETVASRLLWAAGYFANEDYFLSDLRVEHMPQLKRGRKMVGADGTMHDVRLKRYAKGEKKVGPWQWRQNPYSGKRELNGLRVMMALVNNWDLKDENNSILEEKGGDNRAPELHQVVSDLGASFGSAGISFPLKRSKGNLHSYSDSKFIRKVDGQYVDFDVPARPSLILLVNPKRFIMRMHLRWIGRHVPRDDARWLGQLLSQLSEKQIRDAFRAAGYSPEQVEQFSDVVKKRITELEKL
jgi:hypothetical protein